MRKKFNIILVAVLAITLIAEFVVRELSFTTVYSTDTKLDEITYLGKELVSSELMNNVVSSKEVTKTLIKLQENGESNVLGDEADGFSKLSNLTEINTETSYDGLRNLVFNLKFLGIRTCAEQFGVVIEDSTPEMLIKAYLFEKEGALHDAAIAIASSLKCPNYQATITNFDLTTPVDKINGILYYGPFTFSDNTMGFAEVSSVTNCSVYSKSNNDGYTQSKYVDNKTEYYVGVPEGCEKANLTFEGVFFTPKLKFFDNGVAYYGELKNSATSFSFSTRDAIIENEETTEDSAVEQTKSTVSVKVASEGEEIPETVLFYNEQNEISSVIQDNFRASVETELGDGTYNVERIYSDGTYASEETMEEFTVTEGAINANTVETYDAHLGLYDKEEDKLVAGRGYIYTDKDVFVMSISFAEDGMYRSVSLVPGMYSLVIVDIDPKYNIPAEYTFMVQEVNPVINVPVTSGKGTGYLVFKDESGTPVENVNVVLDNDTTKTYTTDANGSVEISKLTEGSHTCMITEVPAGYILPKDIITLAIDNSGSVINKTIVLQKIKFNLRVTKSVEGSTTEVPDAVYSIKQLEAPYFSKVVSVEEFPLTLEVGSYKITEIIPGKGYNFSDETSQTIEATTSENVALNFTTSAQTGSITIRSYSSQSYNTVVPEVAYKLYNLDSEVIAEATSDSNGNVLFEKIPLGTYTLQQESVPENYEQYKKLVQVKITEAGEVKSYDAILAAKVGSITVYHDTVVSGVPYYLYNEKNELLNVLHTDADGIVVFKELTPGSYSVKSAVSSATTNGATPVTTIAKIFEPIVAKAYDGTVTISLDNLNVVLGSNLPSNVKTTAVGTSKIIESSKANGYDTTMSGATDLGTLNVDNISTLISQTAEKVNHSGDTTEVKVDNIVEKDKDKTQDNKIVGDTYTSATGTVVLSKDNTALGDADFGLTESDVAGLLGQSVKLPKTGVPVILKYLQYMMILAAVMLVVNNIPRRKKMSV